MPAPEQSQIYPMRLQKFLARAGVASRRGSEDLMTAGRVSVNGNVVTELGSKVDPNVDIVEVDGKRVNLADGPVYLVLYKPTSCLTTMSDPYGRPCVANLVPTGQYPGLYPVGRLDMHTTGTLLFTTDGDIGQKLLHPSFEKEKTYIALISGTLTPQDVDALEAGGLELEDGPCAPAKVSEITDFRDLPDSISMILDYCVRHTEPVSIWQITIHEGRKHQVKRMFSTLGHKVQALHRTSFGPITVKGMQPGEWRLLSDTEIKQLKEAVGE